MSSSSARRPTAPTARSSSPARGRASWPGPGRAARPGPSGDGPVHRYRVVPAAYVVLLREEADGSDSALLQLRTGTGFMDGHWACGAAGHVEAGESVLAAAAREAAEELGVEVDATELLP